MKEERSAVRKIQSVPEFCGTHMIITEKSLKDIVQNWASTSQFVRDSKPGQ